MECHGSIESVRPSSPVYTANHEREQLDAHLQTSGVASHTGVIEPEQGAVTQQRLMSA